MKSNHTTIIQELPEKTLLTRKEAASILGIGLSTLDTLVSLRELPRTKIRKHVFVLRSDLEDYILAHRIAGGEK